MLNEMKLEATKSNNIVMTEIELDEMNTLEETVTPALGGLCGLGCGGAVCGIWC